MAFAAKMEKEKLTWTNINAESLPKALVKPFKDFKAASTAAGELRRMFDDKLRATLLSSGKVELEDGQSLRISHQFGKIAFAVSDQPERIARGRDGEFSFD